MYFPVNFAKFLKASFLQNTSRQLLEYRVVGVTIKEELDDCIYFVPGGDGKFEQMTRRKSVITRRQLP